MTARDETEVLGLEQLLLEPEVRADLERLRALLHDDFREHGASGRVWDSSSVLEAVASGGGPVVVTDLAAAPLGPDAVLVTYRSDRAGRVALRSSVWVRAGGRWLLRFHQGTLVTPGP